MTTQFGVLDNYPKIGPAEKAGIIRAFQKKASKSEEFEEFFSKNYLSQNPIYPSKITQGESSLPEIKQLPVAFREEPSLESDESKTIWEILTDANNLRFTSKFVADLSADANKQIKNLLNIKQGDPLVYLVDDTEYMSPFEMTVFVPSNDAYEAREIAVVLNHMIKNNIAQFPKEGELPLYTETPSLRMSMDRSINNGSWLLFRSESRSGKGADINPTSQDPANIVISDIRANNGIIHVIDNVLVPQESHEIPSQQKESNTVSDLDLPELLISSDVNGVDSRRKRKVIKSRYKEIKSKGPKMIYSKRIDKISFSKEPTSFVDRISFSEPTTPSFVDQISLTEEKNMDIVEYSTLKVGLDVLSKYFNLTEDSKTLFEEESERNVMLTEANNIIANLHVDDSEKKRKVKISSKSTSNSNEYSYFSPQKVKKMSTKELWRFIALTTALNSVSSSPKIDVSVFGSSLGSRLADNIILWIEEIMRDVRGIESDLNLLRLTIMEKSGRLAKKIYEKGGVLMIREVSWVIMNISYVLNLIIQNTFILEEFKPEMEITMDHLYKNFGYLGVQKQQVTAQRFFGVFTSTEGKIVNNIVDLTKKVRKEGLPNLQNNMILSEAAKTKKRLYSLLKFTPAEFSAPKKGDPNFIKLNLVALMYASLLSELYYDTKLDDKARENKNSITRNNIWSETVEPFFSNIDNIYPRKQ